MKTTALFMCCLLVPFYSVLKAQSLPSQGTSSVPDSALIRKTGADERGMKKYVFCYLKKGPNRNHSPEEAKMIQAGHMANIQKLADSGYLLLAGPFMDTGIVKGIFIFNTDDIELAKRWTQADPAVQSGRLIMELHPWYGSAALVLLNEWHEKISPRKD